MMVVSDSSPLIALSAIGLHTLMNQLFGDLVIPTAVSRELHARPDEAFRSDLLSAPWLEIREPQNHDLVKSLSQTLGKGEAEPIALAIELNANLLIIDERLGRRTAARFGITPLGVLGILVEAKNQGLIPAVGPILEQLHRQAGFRVTETLIRRVLSDCGE